MNSSCHFKGLLCASGPLCVCFCCQFSFPVYKPPNPQAASGIITSTCREWMLLPVHRGISPAFSFNEQNFTGKLRKNLSTWSQKGSLGDLVEQMDFFFHSSLIKINVTLAHINTTNYKEICSSNFQLAKLRCCYTYGMCWLSLIKGHMGYNNYAAKTVML